MTLRILGPKALACMGCCVHFKDDRTMKIWKLYPHGIIIQINFKETCSCMNTPLDSVLLYRVYSELHL